MELDELKNQWNEMNDKLDTSIRINTRLLRDSVLAKAQSRFRRVAFFVALELLINVPLLFVFGSFIAKHVKEPRFLLPALMLHLFVVAHVASAIHELVTVRSIDYGAPVLSIQRKVARLRIHRVASSTWTLVVAPLLWPPLFIVAVKGLSGIDPYVAFRPWIVANFAFGVGVLVAAVWISRRFGAQMQTSPVIERAMDHLAGRSMSKATRFLSQVTQFAND